jgi:hypothetical protein
MGMLESRPWLLPLLVERAGVRGNGLSSKRDLRPLCNKKYGYLADRVIALST